MKEKITLPRQRKEHPLLALTDAMKAAGTSQRKFAPAVLGITQQSLQKMLERARNDRDYLMPAEHVPVISKFVGIPPHQFNPHLWKRGWTF